MRSILLADSMHRYKLLIQKKPLGRSHILLYPSHCPLED